jgi:hypothetical protein
VSKRVKPTDTANTSQSEEKQRLLDLHIGLALLGDVGRKQYLEYLKIQHARTGHPIHHNKKPVRKRGRAEFPLSPFFAVISHHDFHF